ncbi:uncharacterized protein A4U43_C10F14310 [Asparagus officinalis]|uniref:Transmembrane protein n=1 Tax=Asparagus officinalis TaxID=4686 RepID=A0A5P1E2N2_ASPOF|nr:uncharacterized protein A4U43_C10F14310 [Asparagus officinalis]
MGISLSNSTSKTHKFFLLTNYILIGAATSCIFLALSLRLLPSLIGFLLILLHLLTIILSIFSSSSSATSSSRAHAAHMAATVITAIFQGAVALLIFSRTDGFLEKMKSYVQEDDGVVILRMVGVLGLVMFVLEWVVLVLAFAMRFYIHVEEGPNGKVQHFGDDNANH